MLKVIFDIFLIETVIIFPGTLMIVMYKTFKTKKNIKNTLVYFTAFSVF